jgi:hypothetical protein
MYYLMTKRKEAFIYMHRVHARCRNLQIKMDFGARVVCRTLACPLAPCSSGNTNRIRRTPIGQIKNGQVERLGGKRLGGVPGILS